MAAKRIITAFLLLFIVITTGIVVMKVVAPGNPDGGAKGGEPAVQEVSDSTDAVIPNADVVYYFMTTQRCPSCMKIEAFAKEAVERDFAARLKNGTMIWKMVKVDETANQHFIQDYQLYTKSVVLVRYRDGKQIAWKNLEEVWTLLGDKTAFQN
jgi:hypothetical protein